MNSDPSRETEADNDRCVLRSWHEWEIRGGERRIILCVETALELRSGYPGFDAGALEELVENATDLMRTSTNPIDALRIVPAL
jgi:hypothetical protein